MSILLDALKKSEAQHQLGKPPTLHSPVLAEISSGGIERIWIPAAMVLLATGVIAWTGIAQFHRPETVTDGLAQAPALNEPAVRAAIPAPEPAETAQRTAKTPVMEYTEERQPAPSRKVTEKSQRSTAGKTTERPSGDVQRKPGIEQRTAAAADRQPLSVSQQEPVAEQPQHEAGLRRQQKDRLEPFVADAISYWQVPQSVREDMPQLRMTVLVYAEKPQDRFLLINGQRLHEKDELDKGLVLEEIQRDRAIFTYRSYRFHLKN
jgi:general secretion pathway protein B